MKKVVIVSLMIVVCEGQASRGGLLPKPGELVYSVPHRPTPPELPPKINQLSPKPQVSRPLPLTPPERRAADAERRAADAAKNAKIVAEENTKLDVANQIRDAQLYNGPFVSSAQAKEKMDLLRREYSPRGITENETLLNAAVNRKAPVNTDQSIYQDFRSLHPLGNTTENQTLHYAQLSFPTLKETTRVSDERVQYAPIDTKKTKEASRMPVADKSMYMAREDMKKPPKEPFYAPIEFREGHSQVPVVDLPKTPGGKSTTSKGTVSTEPAHPLAE